LWQQLSLVSHEIVQSPSARHAPSAGFWIPEPEPEPSLFLQPAAKANPISNAMRAYIAINDTALAAPSASAPRASAAARPASADCTSAPDTAGSLLAPGRP